MEKNSRPVKQKPQVISSSGSTMHWHYVSLLCENGPVSDNRSVRCGTAIGYAAPLHTIKRKRARDNNECQFPAEQLQQQHCSSSNCLDWRGARSR